MKTYQELISELTIQQRLKRSRTSKVKAKVAKRKREITMKKPPTPERIQKAVKRAVRARAIGLVDKAGIYKSASGGIKDKIEKKENLKIQKLGSRWTKRLLPQVRKDMKDAFRTRMKSSSTKDLRDED